MARSFNGSSDRIVADAAASFREGVAYSVSLWLNASLGGIGSGLPAFMEGNSASNNAFFQIECFANDKSKIAVVIRNNGGGTSQVGGSSGSAKTFFDGTWHHFLFTQDDSSPCNWWGYIDGVLDVNLNGSYTPGATTINRLTLGCFRGNTITNFYPGLIAQVAKWSRRLSDGEAKALAAGLPPSYLTPDHYWPLLGGPVEPDHGSGVRVAGSLTGTTFTGDHPARAAIWLPRSWVDQRSPLLHAAPAAGAITIAAPPATATFSAAAPTAGFPITITAPPATVTFSAAAPTILTGIVVRPSPATTTFGAAAPEVSTVLGSAPATVTFDAAAPTISVGGNITISPAPGSVTFDAAAPSFAIVGVAGGPLAAVSFTPGTDWRLVICDLMGRPISIVSGLAHQKQIVAHLNRPMQASFTVAADDPRVNSVHTDGYPYLWPGVRTMKWYRRELSGWKLRFNGYVWSINPVERDPDSNVVDIAVTCFDPYQRLMKRLCRNATGGFDSTVVFTSVDGILIAKTLVDRTISFKGPVGIETSGTFGHASVQTVGYDQAFIGQALTDLTDTLTMDLIFEPVDRTDGILAVMGAVAERGHDRPSVIFGYDLLPHSTLGFNRTVNMDDFANDITLYSGPTTTGKKESVEQRTDAASAAIFGWYEDAQAITEITDPTLLGTLADTELSLRKMPRDLLSFQPIPEKSPHPWGDWWLGDTVQVQASKNTGAAVTGSQRIYGATIDIDDQDYEIVSELVVSPDGL